MTAWVDLDRSAPISRHLSSLCTEASDSTYVRDVDLKAWAELPGKFIAFALYINIQRFPSFLYFLYFFPMCGINIFTFPE